MWCDTIHGHGNCSLLVSLRNFGMSYSPYRPLLSRKEQADCIAVFQVLVPTIGRVVIYILTMYIANVCDEVLISGTAYCLTCYILLSHVLHFRPLRLGKQTIWQNVFQIMMRVVWNIQFSHSGSNMWGNQHVSCRCRGVEVYMRAVSPMRCFQELYLLPCICFQGVIAI